MRTFHTQTESGLELQGDAVSIGRGSSQPLLQSGNFAQIGSTKKHETKAGSFSSISKWSVMLKNLQRGLEFMEKQNFNLKEMESVLLNWRKDSARPSSGYSYSFPPETFLYLQTIMSLSEEKLFNHPLFGSGYEPPIRIHLNMKGERFTQEVPVLPLLNQPAFCALTHSSGSSRRPSDLLFDSCEMEFVNTLLILDRNLEGLRRQLRAVEECDPRPVQDALSPVRKTELQLSSLSRFSRFMNWVNRSIIPRRAAQVYPV